MTAKGVRRQGNYPVARYRYKPGDHKHPQEEVECLGCRVRAWVRKGAHFCSVSCAQTLRNSSARPLSTNYQTLHQRVRVARGWADEHLCPCGESAKDWANQTGHYDDIADYIAMCRKCHGAFDAGRRRVQRGGQ